MTKLSIYALFAFDKIQPEKLNSFVEEVFANQ
jgi:hypothetical protein